MTRRASARFAGKQRGSPDAPIGPPSLALFPAAAERQRLDDELTRALIESGARIPRGSVVPDFDRETFRRELEAFDFSTPRPLSDVLAWTMAQLEHGVVHMTHPSYFGLFNPAPAFPAQCADRIAAALNPQLASATTSPAAVDIERHVVRALGARAGLGEGVTGHFTSGGSEANATALLLALASSHEAYVQDGVRAFSGQPVFYVSRESHLAWIKIAQQTGLGRAGAQMIATDGTGRMDTGELASAIERDRASGRLPVMVAATAGTTGAGMIDPLEASAAVARRHGLWFHVDAAWAGALIASKHLRGALAGIELADSITIDAHKWFAATMGCGVLLTRHATSPSKTFEVAAGYMPSQSASVDPYMTSLQWSRRFLGLRLFLCLAAAGWDGYGSHVERAVELMAVLRCTMTAKGWTVANDSPAAVVCLIPPAGSAQVRSIVERVVASGKAWISVAKLEGSDIVRVCATHGETTIEDIHHLADDLCRAAQEPVTPSTCNASPASATYVR